MEIERKFLVKKVPQELDQYEMQEMQQAYLCDDPVIRVRSIRQKDVMEYVLTIKGRGMVIREEHELPLSKEKFEQLLEKREGRILSKKRYRIPLSDGHVAELDVYEGDYAGMYTVEVEFKDEKDLAGFQVPVWFGEDVSEERRYKNSTLCMGKC